ncbi:hypothetical protein TKK_0017108 [Trichogramma kaykai]
MNPNANLQGKTGARKPNPWPTPDSSRRNRSNRQTGQTSQKKKDATSKPETRKKETAPDGKQRGAKLDTRRLHILIPLEMSKEDAIKILAEYGPIDHFDFLPVGPEKHDMQAIFIRYCTEEGTAEAKRSQRFKGEVRDHEAICARQIAIEEQDYWRGSELKAHSIRNFKTHYFCDRGIDRTAWGEHVKECNIKNFTLSMVG